jgi:hypothetical protein
MLDDRAPRPAEPGREYWGFVAIIIGLTLIAGLVLLFNYWPLLRGGFGWIWPYASPTASALARLAPALLTLLLFGAGLRLLRRSPDWLYLVWCIIGAFAIPIVFLLVAGDPLFLLFSRTISKISTGPFAASLTITNPAKTVADWPALMFSLRYPYPHLAISSPIWPILYYSIQGLLARLPGPSAWLASLLVPLRCQDFTFLALSDAQIASAWVGITSPLWPALAAIPLFHLAKGAGGRNAARTTVAWWPLIPALTVFVGTLNTAYLLPSTATIAILWGSLRAPGKKIPLSAHAGRFLAGVLAGMLVIWNFSLVPLLLLFAVLILLRWLLGATLNFAGLRWALLAGIELALGVIFTGGLYTALAGHSPLELLRISMQIHTGLVRPYLPWLLLHTWDVILFAGLPVSILAVFGWLAASGREAPLRQLGLALGATLAVLILSGTARGETGRVWIFFMPLIVLLAAGGLAALGGRQRSLLAAGQGFWLIAMALVLRPVSTVEIRPPPSYTDLANSPMPEPILATDASFGGQLRLIGYQARYEPESQTLRLALHWQGIEPTRKPYYFSAIPVAPGRAGALPSTNWQPFATRFPTTCWPAGTEVVDQVELPLGSEPPSGDWWVSLSVFEFREDQPPLFIPVRLPGGAEDQQVGLGPIAVRTGQ